MQTIVTLVMDGRDAMRALTISFISLFREIIRSGLNALRTLNAFNACKLSVTLSPPLGVLS